MVTDPVPDTEVQKGFVYYERKGNGFESGVHINEINGKPVPKTIVFAGGVLRMYDKLPDQVTTIKKAGQYQSYLALGFGASGKDLLQKFDAKYLGSETVSGVKTEKLELVAKDPEVLKNFPKMTIWMDLSRGVSLKQVFDQGAGPVARLHLLQHQVQSVVARGCFHLQDRQQNPVHHPIKRPAVRRKQLWKALERRTRLGRSHRLRSAPLSFCANPTAKNCGGNSRHLVTPACFCLIAMARTPIECYSSHHRAQNWTEFQAIRGSCAALDATMEVLIHVNSQSNQAPAHRRLGGNLCTHWNSRLCLRCAGKSAGSGWRRIGSAAALHRSRQ